MLTLKTKSSKLCKLILNVLYLSCENATAILAATRNIEFELRKYDRNSPIKAMRRTELHFI